jgi:outer membrane protein TolC
MKKITALSLILIGVFSMGASAQESIIPDINYTTLDKYIAAAKDYFPRRKVFKYQEEISKTVVTTATLSYLDLFSASYFWRPGDKAAISDPSNPTFNPYVFNGVQVGISLNLGNYAAKPVAVRRAKLEYKVAQLQTQDYEIALVRDVRQRYYNYIQALAQLKVRTQASQDNASVSANARNKFERGEIQIDVYNAARLLLSESNIRQIESELLYLNAKDILEEIIGKKLSDIK